MGGSGAAVGLILGGALTQWASWRWCLYVNVVLAALAVLGVVTLVDASRGERRARLDVLGTVLASGGLFFVVFGFARAVTTSWGDAVTWGSLALGVAALGLFVVARAEPPTRCCRCAWSCIARAGDRRSPSSSRASASSRCRCSSPTT